jgi:alkylation response protein AidB-like acyl-CoA dehydrogenase
MAVLTEEQTMLRDMAREWADNESPVTAFRKMRDAAPAEFYDAKAWRAQAEMGWAGILMPEAQGGAGMGYLSLGLVLEQLGRNLTATPLAATAAATSALIARRIRGAAGRMAAADRRGRSGGGAGDRRGPALRARADRHGPSMGGADRHQAIRRRRGQRAALRRGRQGRALSRLGRRRRDASPRKLADSRSHAQVRFDGAPAEKLAGGADLLTAGDRSRAAALCAEMLGMAEAAFAQTNDYLKTRVQFGQVLASFQALQHRMAKMFTELELMRSAVEGALEAIDADRADVSQAVSLAKAVAGDTLHLVSREMIQLHGGIGMTDEHDAGFYLKRARVLEAMWGNAAWHRERFARLNGY